MVMGTLLSANATLTHRVFTASEGSLSAQATFDVGGNTLTVLLENTSTADVLAPGDVLTALFWDPTGNLTPVSAVLGGSSTVLFAQTGRAGPALGGEWAYRSGLSGGPAGAALGISSSGFNLFGPGDLFPPGINLQGPASPDGLQYGITSIRDNPSTGNAAVTGRNALIQNSVLFTLRFTGTYDLADVHNVSFQYGTALTDANITPVPEPSTFIAGALLLIPLLAQFRRWKRSA